MLDMPKTVAGKVFDERYVVPGREAYKLDGRSYWTLENPFQEPENFDSFAKKQEKLNLFDIRKAIRPECFVKNTSKGLFFWFFDIFLWLGLVYLQILLVPSLQKLPYLFQFIEWIVFYFVLGMVMACQFCQGHDCGHWLVTNSKMLDIVLGHISFASVMVPYLSFQTSHWMHHRGNHHVHDDFGTPTWTHQEIEIPERSDPFWPARMKFLIDRPVLTGCMMPFLGWHWLNFVDFWYMPFTRKKFWVDFPIENAIWGNFFVLCFMFSVYLVAGSFQTFLIYYLLPQIPAAWAMFSMTYLQHHHPNSICYDDSTFHFAKGAMETTDRHWGFGIDRLWHQATNGHLAHHLFFQSIPMHELGRATEDIDKYLEKHNLGHLHQKESEFCFFAEIFQVMRDTGFWASLISFRR